jgi:hypothetical protein
MENVLWYLAGLLTPVGYVLLVLLWEWLTDKNLQRDCWICGRSFGVIGEDYVRDTQFRFWWHRRNGECQRNSK